MRLQQTSKPALPEITRVRCQRQIMTLSLSQGKDGNKCSPHQRKTWNIMTALGPCDPASQGQASTVLSVLSIFKVSRPRASLCSRLWGTFYDC